MKIPLFRIQCILILSLSFNIMAQENLGAADLSAEAVKINTWEVIRTGGKTLCSDGSDYKFYHQNGTSDNLIIFFSPGGACWDDDSCEKSIFWQQPEKSNEGGIYYADALDLNYSTYQTGFFRKDNDQNPFKNWNKVFISYCSGDVHIGDAVQKYTNAIGEEKTIYHRGQENSRAVLNWIGKNYQNPSKVLVSGESAGGHGAIYYLPDIVTMFPSSRIYQLSDGNALTTERFLEITAWWGVDAEENFGFKTSNNTMNDAYLYAIEKFKDNKNVVMLQQNTIRDDAMTGFQASTSRINRTDAILARWQQDMTYATKELKKASEPYGNYFYWISNCHLDTETNTTPHCLEWNDVFYTCEQGGLFFYQWLDRIINKDERLDVGAEFLPGELK
ncbi:pectin acetylesterase-family hydrolase [Lutimonas sp.]|uniref:pectin acetylesterase-family hydrolase n=1 Tax=Lutimonas sp. TaxID=1872403 RepID=UPI003D9B3BA4